MAETVEVVDQTLRDGQQSLWGMRMRAGHITGAAEHIRNAGFHVVDLSGGSQFTCQMRYLREDPWQWLDHVSGILDGCTLRAGMRPSSSGGFGINPRSILELKTKVMIDHGISSFWVYDCLFDLAEMEHTCRKAKQYGAQEVLGALLYGISPVHTDEFYAEKVRGMVAWGGVIDGIYLEDAPGILLPERAATLVPAVVEAAQGLPVEIHCHNTVGMAPLNYAEALRHGVRIVHTASRPLANGPSLPSTEQMTANLEALGYAHRIDRSRLAPIADHFERVAIQEGHELGVPAEWDASLYLHQLPGGMMGTFKAQLVQHGMADRLPAVLEEIVQVREEFGHPISATPFSQLIGTQALLNVVSGGERYSVTTDEVIMYVYGHLGETPAPVDQEMADRVTDSPRGRALRDFTRPDDTLDEMRVKYGGADLSDEELLRRFFAPLEDVEATGAAGPLRPDFAFEDDGADLLALVQRAVSTSSRANRISLHTPGVTVDLSREAG